MKQNLVTEKTPLLDADGNIAVPGYAVRSDVYQYDRQQILGKKLRIKEWDFYQLANEDCFVQFVIADISFGGAVTFCYQNFKTGERQEALMLDLLTFGKFKLGKDAEAEQVFEKKQGNAYAYCEVTKTKRHIKFRKGNNIDLDITLDVMPDLESLVMAVPFEKNDGHFYYNQKMNSMPTRGFIRIGEKTHNFDPKNTFTVLDWGRGVWPYKEAWYWGNGSHRLENGDIFGFELGWGFGVMKDFTENTLFYNGKAHKIGEVEMVKSPHDYMQPWHFTEKEGRLDLTMTPFFDNFTSTRVLGVVGNKCHQVFGRFNGKAILDDGTEVKIKDMIAFCEYSDNRW